MRTSELASAAGISKGYASDILNGRRKLGLVAALRVFRATGKRMGPLETMADDAIAALADDPQPVEQ